MTELISETHMRGKRLFCILLKRQLTKIKNIGYCCHKERCTTKNRKMETESQVNGTGEKKSESGFGVSVYAE